MDIQKNIALFAEMSKDLKGEHALMERLLNAYVTGKISRETMSPEFVKGFLGGLSR